MNAVSDLWIDLRLLHLPLVNLFNEFAGPDDIARIEHMEDLALLDQISVGRKLVVFRSVAEAEQAIPRIADRVDIVGYNLEDRAASPANERADPIASAKRMRNVADEHGLMLAFGPDHDFALSHGVDIAPFVDIFVLQIQLAQTQPQRVFDFIMPLIPELREANPNLEISVQIRTEGNLEALVDLVDAIRIDENDAGHPCMLLLEGISILSRRDTISVAEELIETIHSRQAPTSEACLVAEVKPRDAPSNSSGPANGAPSANPEPSQWASEPGLTAAICAIVGAIVGSGTFLGLKCASQKQ